MDHIGSVLVQRARKWDRDRKQIQITAIALEIAADQLCKLKNSNRVWFRAQHKGSLPAGDMRGKLISSERCRIEIGLVVALGWK